MSSSDFSNLSIEFESQTSAQEEFTFMDTTQRRSRTITTHLQSNTYPLSKFYLQLFDRDELFDRYMFMRNLPAQEMREIFARGKLQARVNLLRSGAYTSLYTLIIVLIIIASLWAWNRSSEPIFAYAITPIGIALLTTIFVYKHGRHCYYWCKIINRLSSVNSILHQLADV